MPLIDIQNLTRWYQWQKPLFDNFNFQLQENDFCFVMGKSGVGKTTLVKFLMRQLRPPLRTVFHGKDDIARYSDTEVQKYRRDIGVVFQDFKLIDRKTTEQNLRYPLELTERKPASIQDRVKKMIHMLELQKQKDQKSPSLSGWEKQRVAIGRALINNPEFVIADEPTGNLDRESSKNIADLLIQSHKAGNTILFITHDKALVEYVQSQHEVKVVSIDE